MMAGELYLGFLGNEIKLTPSGRGELQINRIEEARKDEMVSGRLVKDILWRKKEFTIPYEEIKGEDLKQIIELYNSGEFLNFKFTNEDGNTEEYLVEMQSFNQDRIDFIGDWYWGNVKIELRQVNP